MEGRLVKNTAVRRFHLQAADDCLAWAQRAYTDSQQCQLDFWSWATGLERHQLLRRDFLQGQSLLAESGAWPWLRLQRRAGKLVIKLFAGFKAGKPQVVRVIPRSLLKVELASGPEIIRWFPPLNLPQKPWDWFILFFDELLAKLDGASAEIVDVCPVCSRWFIRARADKKEWCSVACRSRAVYRQRKQKQERRKLTKQAKVERNPRSENGPQPGT